MKPYSEQKGRVYTEDDWLPQTEKDCEEAEKNEKYVHSLTCLILARRLTPQPNGRFVVVLRFQEVRRDCRFRDPKAGWCEVHPRSYKPT